MWRHHNEMILVLYAFVNSAKSTTRDRQFVVVAPPDALEREKIGIVRSAKRVPG